MALAQSIEKSWSWLRGVDLNHRPLGYEPNELPDCSTPHFHDSNGAERRQFSSLEVGIRPRFPDENCRRDKRLTPGGRGVAKRFRKKYIFLSEIEPANS
jgi:hypothetical protein